MSRAAPPGAMAALLEALPRGGRVWITTRGRSLWPVLRGGEQLQALRCDPGELQRGDLAVLLTREGRLVAHVVVGTSPLKTAAFNGRPDPDGWRALARVAAVKVRGRAVPLPRRLMRFAQRAWSGVAQLPPAQMAWTFIIATWGSRSTRRLRSLALGPVEVRMAGESDRSEVMAALAMHEVFTDEALERVVDGATAALAIARGSTVGIALHDTRGRLLRARMLRRAVGQGIEQRLIDALVSTGLCEAEIEGLRPSFVTALARHGFQPRDGRRVWKRLQDARPMPQP